MKAAPLVQSMVLAVIAAVISWWITPSRVTLPPPDAPSATAGNPIISLPAAAALSMPSLSAEGTLGFIRALQHAPAMDLSVAFAATRDAALRQAIIMRWAGLDPSGCWEHLLD